MSEEAAELAAPSTLRADAGFTPGDQRALDELRATWTPPDGWISRFSAVQNSRIALRYLTAIFVLFLIAGLMGLLIRLQLAVPENGFLEPGFYNALFTMHGSTMMYLVAVPGMVALGVLLLPQMLGARDLPYPRMTAFGFWAFLFGAVFMYASFFFGTPPTGGWTAYVPLSGKQFSPDMGMDFWLLGLFLVELSSLGAGVEFVAAVFKTRAPGMALHRIPLFAWALLTMGLMIIFGFTPLLVATTFLELDRAFGTKFYDAAAGGSPVLWQHLFWIFGHPEVYIQFLPATGVISTALPSLVRRPIVGYTAIVLAITGIGVLSFGLWVHHMFATGIPLQAMTFFSAASLSIAILSGIQVFAWIATIWGGSPVWNTALWFVIGTIVTFVAGGLTGVMVALVPFDWQVHDTFFVVAHFHYVLIGGVILPLFAAFYYWLPKVTGKLLSERLGRWNFWMIFLGFNLTFFPMHVAGLVGMPRRIYTYRADLGFELSNLTATIGSFVFGIGVLLFIANFFYSRRFGENAGANPWRAGGLEWATPERLQTPFFVALPIVRSRYPLWDQDRLDTGDAATERIAEGLARSPRDVRAMLVTSVIDAEPETIARVPGATYWPLALALSLAVIFAGTLAEYYALALAGIAAALVCLIAWDWPEKEIRGTGDSADSLHGLSLHATGSAALAWWAMLGVLAILGIAVACLVFSYFFLAVTVPANDQTLWPPTETGVPALGLPSAATLVLLAGAAAVAFVGRRVAADSFARVLLTLGPATVLGTVFLALQIASYTGAEFSITSHAYGSIFLGSLLFHGLIASAAVIFSCTVLAQTSTGGSLRWRRVAVQNAALLWYFVAASWIVLYGVLYLSPRFF